MTTNVLPSPYVASASAIESASFDAYRAFDANTAGTQWSPSGTGGGYVNAWLKIDLSTAQILVKCIIYSATN